MNLANDRFILRRGDLDLYQDWVTDHMYDKLREIDAHGISFPRYNAYRMNQDGKKLGYIVVDDQDIPVFSFECGGLEGDLFAVDMRMLALRCRTRDELDIREMAQTGKVFRQ